MLAVNSNESLYSLIFRTHIVYGILDFSNIIRANGALEPLPKILKGTLHLYEPIDDFLFLNLLRDLGFAKELKFAFSNPFHYRNDLNYLFGFSKRVRTNLAGTHEVRYCLECVKDSIIEFGYGILKSEWYKNRYCFKHEKCLNYFVPKGRKKTVDSLKCVLRGEHPEYSLEISSEYQNINFFSPYAAAQVEYILPCLVNELKRFILYNIELIKNDILGRKYNISHVFYPKVMDFIINQLKKHNFSFRLFWDENAILESIPGGVVDKNSIYVEAFKMKSADCQNCKDYHCYINMTIKGSGVREDI